ncbi:MAG: transcriptional repressor [Eubacteriales bacterium]|nr:transcriptional repressor [Eubacteriales bacterium]
MRDNKLSGNDCYERTRMQKETILRQLKDNGCRITRQRKILLDIILQEECSCCKEIYYKALEADAGIGAATVYRMINTLEEIGAISRKNMYRVSCEEDCREEEKKKVCTVEFEDEELCQLSDENWKTVVQEGMKACGYFKDKKIKNIYMDS